MHGMLLFQAFVAAMPRVRPHYAIKCNSDHVMLSVLAALGCGFDCASPPEVAAALEAGAAPEDIIFASTCKRPTDMRCVVSNNIRVRRCLFSWTGASHYALGLAYIARPRLHIRFPSVSNT